MMPMINSRALGSTDHTGIVVPVPSSSNNFANPLCIACGGNYDPSQGLTGIERNMFADPIKAYNGYRPYLMGIDSRAMDLGPIYGMARWNLDLTIAKQTKVTERVGFTVYAQMLNALNHMMWADPGLNLQGASGFGVIGGQYNPNGTGVSINRVIELGLRIYF
jgi:hypothetical protein